MNTDSNIPQPFDILSRAIAYFAGGVLLYNVNLENVSLSAKVLGIIFIIFAFLLGIASFSGKLKIAGKVDYCLFIGLFIAALAGLAIIIQDYRELIWVFVPFIILIPLSMIFNTWKTTMNEIKEKGRTMAIKRILRTLSLVLSLFALVMVIIPADFYGGPVFYLAISVVCLTSSLLLRKESTGETK